MASDTQFAGKRVLVTGASGFIGSRLCRRLLEAGSEVHGVSRTEQEDQPGLRWWVANFEEIARCQQVLTEVKPEFVFDLASLVSGNRGIEFVLPIFHANLKAAVNLLTVATEVGCKRVVLTGSLEEPEGDAATSVPSSPYAAAKWAATGYARMFHALYGTPVAVARVFMVYGPGHQALSKLIPYVITSLLRGESPELMGGTREIDWIFVDDVVDGYCLLATREGLEGQTVDLGTGTSMPVRQVVEKLTALIDSDASPRFESLPDRPMERVRVAQIENTYESIGWRPKTTLDEGLRQTVKWFKEQVKSGLL